MVPPHRIGIQRGGGLWRFLENLPHCCRGPRFGEGGVGASEDGRLLGPAIPSWNMFTFCCLVTSVVLAHHLLAVVVLLLCLIHSRLEFLGRGGSIVGLARLIIVHARRQLHVDLLLRR